MLKNLATVMVRPRATMRRILDGGGRRMVIPLVLLAICAGLLGDVNPAELEKVMSQAGGATLAGIVAAIILATLLVSMLLFYVFGWIVYGAARLLDGRSTPTDVRAALAWGLAPMVWSLLYALPMAIFWPPARNAVRMGTWAIDSGPMLSGCGLGLLGALLDLIAFVWTIAVMSGTVAEVHGFSTWRGLGTLLLALAVPIVVVLAGILSFVI